MNWMSRFLGAADCVESEYQDTASNRGLLNASSQAEKNDFPSHRYYPEQMRYQTLMYFCRQRQLF